MKYVLVILILIFLLSCTSQQENTFSQDITGLPDVRPSSVVSLQPNATFDLTAQVVKNNINGSLVRMFGYNGQIPGPVLHVQPNSTVIVRFKNELDMPSTVHWHGVRLEDKYDGVPDVTQKIVLPGETFEYHVTFPDKGVFWYHPHVREDMQQESGLYGMIIVGNESFTQQELLILDDILVTQHTLKSFFQDKVTHALMGRFGNIILVNGETHYTRTVAQGSIADFITVNTANTRTFNLSIENHTLHVLESDGSPYEESFFTDSLLLSPGERARFQILFSEQGTFTLHHKSPENSLVLGTVLVNESTQLPEQSTTIRKTHLFSGDINTYRTATPDYEIIITLDASTLAKHHMNDMAIEWEDSMPLANEQATNTTLRWILRDKHTGKENMDIHYKVRLGEIKKVRFLSDPHAAHSMQHPLHIHGQRFLVLNENGKENTNLAWKDVVLVPNGEYVDVLVDFTNPGMWVFHCHISEHAESGMMGMFEVIQ